MSSKTILARELGVSRGCLYYRPKKPDKDWKTKYAIELALRIVDSVRTIIQRQNDYIYIPDLKEYANT